MANALARLPKPPPNEVRPEAKEGIAALPLEARQTEHGWLFARDVLHAAEHRHGQVPVAGALDVRPEHLAQLALDPALEAVRLDRMLLLDLETTGLSGGTGTYPIVVGLAFFEGRRLLVRQFFLRRPGEEGPMLRELAERVSAASCLVTFNGKSFDWPLVRNRFVMNRLRAPVPPPHLDLLHCSRRVFRWRGGGTRLSEIEEQVIGHRRVGDVDGAFIPELYFRYLRDGRAARLLPVLDHNVQDVLLLAALIAELASAYADPEREADARDRFGLAVSAFRAGDEERALKFARLASAGLEGALRGEALALEGKLLSRSGAHRDAAKALRAALECAEGDRLQAIHLELAKLCEHRLRDLPSALAHARAASGYEGAEAAKRIARLERRIAITAPLLGER